MLMGTSVRLVTFQFMPMALHFNVKHLFCYVLMCFFESDFVRSLYYYYYYCYSSRSWKEEPVCNSVFYSDITFLKPYTEVVGSHTSRTVALPATLHHACVSCNPEVSNLPVFNRIRLTLIVPISGNIIEYL